MIQFFIILVVMCLACGFVLTRSDFMWIWTLIMRALWSAFYIPQVPVRLLALGVMGIHDKFKRKPK